jgi:metal-dependent amidase/aminoacylase/carboxypeptidase family protein
MAIGAAWAEIWNEAIWGPVWSQDAPSPPAEDDETTTGGIARRKPRKKRRMFVEIDGNQFPVNSAAEAAQLLSQARALAERKAEQSAATAETNVRRIARRTGTIPALKVKAPDIRVSPELKAESRAVIAEIDRLYKQAATIAELRILMEERLKKEAADEMEAELLLLL